MREIITKSAKLKPTEKKKFRKYWRLIYGPAYADEMAADGCGKPGGLEASSQKKEQGDNLGAV